MVFLRAFLFFILAFAATAQTISTIAGGGTGDGNAATQAFLNLPFGVAVDASGNILIADQNEHRIRKVDSRGIITTLAGNGIAGFADGSGAQAQFNYPAAMRVDGSGNIYVADSANHRIRRISPAGEVTTFAGTGTAGDSGNFGAATAAQLRTPFGVAVDTSGNVYIADSNNHRIKRVNSTGVITPVAGTGSPGFSGDNGPATSAELNFPLGVAADAAGNIYVADSGNSRIRKIDAGGRITTFAGTGTAGSTGDNGQATQARLNSPQDVLVGPDGNIYIADAGSSVAVVRRVDAQGIISTVAGMLTGLGLGGDAGLANRALLFNPAGLAIDGAGRLYISDSANHRVRVVESGVIRTFAGGAVLDGGAGTAAGLATPAGLRVDALGNLYIADSANHRIRRIDASGGIRTAVGTGLPGSIGDNGPATSAALFLPQGVAFDSAGNMYIADTGNHKVRKVTPAGVISTFAGTGSPSYSQAEDGGPANRARLSGPTAVAVDGAGNVFIADRFNRRVRKVDAAGTITTVAGNGRTTLCGTSLSCGDGGLATAASFADPRDLALDSRGNIYVVDGSTPSTTNQLIGGFRIRQIDAAGTIRTIAGNGQAEATGDGNAPTGAGIGVPGGIAIDAAGTIFISDERNHRIRRLVPGGAISTLAGGVSGFSGDGGPASEARLTRPRALVIDTGGNLLVSDSGNQRVRKITGVGSVSPRRLVAISGDRQSGPVGGALPQPLVVAVFDGTSPVPGVTVQFTASPAAAVELRPAEATTDAGGQVSIEVLFKNLPGPVTITANTGSATLQFAVTAVPSLNTGGAVSGASFSAVPLAPGSIVALFGQGLAPTVAAASSLPLPSTLADTVVNIQTASRTLQAPLYFVSPLQINFLLPFEVSDPVVNITISSAGTASAPLALAIAAASPGTFTQNQNGSGPAAVLHADFSLVTAAAPARPGETVLIFCMGLGTVTPAVASGEAAPLEPLSRTSVMPSVTIGGINARVDFSGLAPGFAGLYQLNVQVPSTAGAGQLPLSIIVGSRQSNASTLAVAAQ